MDQEMMEPAISPALQVGKVIRTYKILLSVRERVEQDKSTCSLVDLALDQLNEILPSIKRRRDLKPWCPAYSSTGAPRSPNDISVVEMKRVAAACFDGRVHTHCSSEFEARDF